MDRERHFGNTRLLPLLFLCCYVSTFTFLVLRIAQSANFESIWRRIGSSCSFFPRFFTVGLFLPREPHRSTSGGRLHQIYETMGFCNRIISGVNASREILIGLLYTRASVFELVTENTNTCTFYVSSGSYSSR